MQQVSASFNSRCRFLRFLRCNVFHLILFKFRHTGVTGRPNVDWCESHKAETIRTNVIGVLNVADLCAEKKIHHLLYATGCIFEYDDEHVIGGEKKFTEESIPNFHGSFYSHTKALVEDLLANYPTTCTLRVRMPISDDLSGRNFVTKIVKYASHFYRAFSQLMYPIVSPPSPVILLHTSIRYDKVVNIPNSMTVLTDLLPISLVMANRNLTGIYNFCNPGAISHNEVGDDGCGLNLLPVSYCSVMRGCIIPVSLGDI